VKALIRMVLLLIEALGKVISGSGEGWAPGGLLVFVAPGGLLAVRAALPNREALACPSLAVFSLGLSNPLFRTQEETQTPRSEARSPQAPTRPQTHSFCLQGWSITSEEWDRPCSRPRDACLRLQGPRFGEEIPEVSRWYQASQGP
jgi:hypothetical protein